MKIGGLSVREIADSRGEPTIEVSLESGDIFSAKVPSGKSRGKNEAVVLSTDDAARVLQEVIIPGIAGADFASIKELDEKLIALDGTPNKRKIGGNLALGISVSFARALAASKKIELWEAIKEEFFPRAEAGLPIIFSNLINGGVHAKNNLDIQEYMVVVKPDFGHGGMERTIQKLKDFYKVLGEELRNKPRNSSGDVSFGDEGGYSVNFSDNFAPIDVLQSLIKKYGLEKEFKIGLDVAASSFYENGAYLFGGKKVSSDDLLKIYVDRLGASELIYSVEDPFAEADYGGFSGLLSKFPDKLIVGDDLTVTNSELIEKFAKDGLINGVIIKPNQIGTITETCLAAQAACKYGVKCIVSHRSGETEDAFLVHVARASGAYGVKIGAPEQKERAVKFNELLRIYGGS